MSPTGTQLSIAEANEQQPFTTSHPITSSVVPDSHPSPPIPNSSLDSLEMSSMFHEVELQYIQHPTLGLDVCQRMDECKLV